MIEILESRIAPAMASLQIINPRTATYTDADGDRVTVKVSVGTLTEALFVGNPKGLGDQLEILNLSGGGFDGANLTIKAVKVATGDGLVNVGTINSILHDL